jgi:hypothetical protein
VTTLQNLWQEQRQQRQQELAQRQQQVREILASFQQERQANASQLRDDLSLFQLELQQETQDFLARVSRQRQVQAEQISRLLRNFFKTLQTQTAQLLAEKAANRSAMARQLIQDLSRTRTELNISVALLRADLQEKLRSLQSQNHEFLGHRQQARTQARTQQIQELQAFVVSLQTQVQDCLIELELIRQDRRQQLQQFLQQDRDRRLAEVNALFQQLSEFRHELRHYRAELSNLVWNGSALPAPILQTPLVRSPDQSAVSPFAAVQVRSIPTEVSSAVAQPDAALPIPVIETAKLAQLENPAQLEEAIYNHIHQQNGSRLNEIESALGINRFQAVDTLRSLIKQGLITQRDRVYFIQEEISL